MFITRVEQINMWALVLLLILLSLSATSLASLVAPLRFILGLTVTFLAGGIITLLLEQVTHHRYDWPVRVTLGALHAFLVPPLVLLGVYLVVGHITIRTIVPFYIILALLPWLHRHYWPRAALRSTTVKALPTKVWRGLVKHPLVWALLTVFTVLGVNLGMYAFIPAPDSYSWLVAAERDLPQGVIDTTIEGHRWAFSILLGIFYNLVSSNLFLFFKYILPVSMLLSIFPLWIIAERLKSRFLQYVFLVSVLISPTIILELAIVRQQLIFILYLFSLMGLLVYAARVNDRQIFYLSALYSLLGMAFHPSFIITTMAWLVTIAVVDWRWLWRHKVIVIGAAALAHPWLDHFAIYNTVYRIYEQGNVAVRNFFKLEWNLAFPSRYINSDGYDVGWAGFMGVMRYYGFYVGPVVVSIILILLGILFFNRSGRRYFWNFIARAEFIILIVLTVFYLLIAEIAPRFGKIAYLPDRAWQYLGMIFLFWLVPILYFADERWQHQRSYVRSLGLFLLIPGIVSIGGAAYVNYLNRFVIPPYELEAARWLKENIPEAAVVLSPTSKNTVRYHAGATYVYIRDWNFASFNQEAIGDYLKRVIYTITPRSSRVLTVAETPRDGEGELSAEAKKWYNGYLRETAMAVDESVKDFEHATGALHAVILPGFVQGAASPELLVRWDTLGSELRILARETKESLAAADAPRAAEAAAEKSTESTEESNAPRLAAYVYYAQPHPKNFLKLRPYKAALFKTATHVDLPYDDYPELFEEVYHNSEDTVLIWRIKLTEKQARELGALKAHYERIP